MGGIGDNVESRDAPSGSLEKLEKIMESNKGNVLVKKWNNPVQQSTAWD